VYNSIMFKTYRLKWLLLLLFTTACVGRMVTPVAQTSTMQSSHAATPIISMPSASPIIQPSNTPISITATPTASPLVDIIEQIPAPSLEGNLLGDPTDQPLRVLLPPSYDSSDQRYPAVYFLPGFSSSIEGDYYPPQMVAGLMQSGSIREMILVIPNGENAFDGSFYVNSPVTGNWEDFIVQDVVGYVDAHYRTIPAASARGIAGHSMGGFGALNLGMRHPEVFSAIYAFNPGLFDQKGLAETKTFESPRRIEAFFDEYESLAGRPLDEVIRRVQHTNTTQLFSFAYGAAFAPNPKAAAPYFDFPYRSQSGQLVLDENTWQRWQAGLGDWKAKIRENKDNLLQLNGIVIDYGEEDSLTWIPKGCRYVSRLLNAVGIDHTLIGEQRAHADQLTERIVGLMLPFFSERLALP
jgi:S-formylglutathione hydrolase